ncbi:hypothetical protein KW805_02850 [Candidatus Pacearchaeota archaeon]|nr:hypothetical protein [Candidatus Pacearchaeota archaeon]
MQIIGFNFTKIVATKEGSFSAASLKTNPTINVEFTSIEKDKLDLLKDNEIVRVSFKFSVAYGESRDKPDAEILMEGFIVLSLDKNQSKDILKNWKKKMVAPPLQMNLSNIVLKRCTIKALVLEEELNLPTHIRLPQLRMQPKPED